MQVILSQSNLYPAQYPTTVSGNIYLSFSTAWSSWQYDILFWHHHLLQWVDDLADAGANQYTFHLEATSKFNSLIPRSPDVVSRPVFHGWQGNWNSLVPRLSRNANMYRGESLVSFLRKHDVIKIGPKQKGNVLRVVQPCFNAQCVCYSTPDS